MAIDNPGLTAGAVVSAARFAGLAWSASRLTGRRPAVQWIRVSPHAFGDRPEAGGTVGPACLRALPDRPEAGGTVDPHEPARSSRPA